jgi:hypothetical protein
MGVHPDARRLIRESETYAVLNRQAVLGFRSSYALRLYEMGALRLHRRQSAWRADMTAVRAAFGIAPELYKDFAQLRRKVLDKAKAEIDHLAHFTVDWREIRRGRAIVELEFHFHPKTAPEQLLTVAEIERHAAGREARRDGAVEEILVEAPALPAPPRPVPPRGAAAGQGRAVGREHRFSERELAVWAGSVRRDRQDARRRLGPGPDRGGLSRTDGRAPRRSYRPEACEVLDGLLPGLCRASRPALRAQLHRCNFGASRSLPATVKASPPVAGASCSGSSLAGAERHHSGHAGNCTGAIWRRIAAKSDTRSHQLCDSRPGQERALRVRHASPVRSG